MAILGFSSSKPASEYLQPGHLGAAAALKGQVPKRKSRHVPTPRLHRAPLPALTSTPSEVQPRSWHGGTPLLAETRRDTISLSSPSRPSQHSAASPTDAAKQEPDAVALRLPRRGRDTLIIRRHHHLNLLAPLLRHRLCLLRPIQNQEESESSHGSIANEATGKDSPVRKSSDRLNPSKNFYTDSCLDEHEHPMGSEELGLPSVGPGSSRILYGIPQPWSRRVLLSLLPLSGGSSEQSKRTKSTLLIIDERGKGRRPKMRSRKETFGLAERHPGAFAAIELYPLLSWPIRAAN